MNAMVNGLLQAGHTVKVLAANTNKYRVEPKSIPADFALNTQIEFVELDLSLRINAALYTLIAGKSYHITRFHTKDFETKIAQVLTEQQFDIVQIETLQMATYLDLIRKHTKAPVVLRAHNIEHRIWQRIADNTSNPLKKAYLRQLCRTLKQFELITLRKMDGIVAITPVDAQDIASLTEHPHIISIPFGINLEHIPLQPEKTVDVSLFHIGAMNWMPNAEGIAWFLEQVWPMVNRRMPDLKLHLAGRYMPDWLLKLQAPNVMVEGEVPEVWQYMMQYAVMIVPLFSGSGIRIKIVEAMAAGKAIVTTAIGAEGINCVDGKHLLVANDAAAFADAVVELCNNPALIKSLGDSAKVLIADEHNNARLMDRLTAFYAMLLDKKSER